jgi:basic amino acid/polyamine antiporter, APA family
LKPPERELGLWSVAALVVGHTIGVGIFLTPAELIGGLRSPAVTLGLWIFCGVLVLAGALTFGELASRYPEAGGPYVYLREGWGERAAFLYGWQSLLIMDPGVTAVLATGSSQYLGVIWPAAAVARHWAAVGIIWALALINMAGLKLSARVFGAMTVIKLVTLAAIVVVAFTWGRGSWENFQPVVGDRPGSPPSAEALAIALVSVFFSFAGFWEASRMAGDVREPGRALPWALALGVVCLILVYTVTTSAFIYLVPAQEVSSAPEFARRAGEAMLGSAGPTVLAASVLLSVVASAMALLIMAPRVYLAMSRDGLFPVVLASVNPVTNAPVRAITLLSVLASVFVLVGTFEQIMSFLICTTLGFIALAAAALVVIRRRVPPVFGDSLAFSAPGYPYTTVSFVLLVVAVVVLVAINRPLQAMIGLVIVFLGLPAYQMLRKGGTR